MLLAWVLLVTASLMSIGTAAPAGAVSTGVCWAWNMDSKATGNFLTNGSHNGVTAVEGTYTLSDFKVNSSIYPTVEVGSISDGTYAFGSQPPYSFVWNGSAPTIIQRNSYVDQGWNRNGFGIYNDSTDGSGAYIGFGIESSYIADEVYGTSRYSSTNTISLSPTVRSACDASPPLAAPAFTLSSASGSATTGSAITSYTLDASGGGTVESYTISPAISNGTLSFSTSTGLLSGTPSTAASATTYTITAHNATAPDATRTYALTINPAAYSSGTGAVDCGTSGYFSISSNVVTGNSSCAGTAVIPSGVTNILAEAFTANALVTSVYIPNTVLTIGQAAFYADTSLATVTFQANSSLTTIGNSVFERTAVTTIALPNSITSLGNYAFYNVTSLVSITLPNAITNIFEHTFDGCSSLASITIPNTIESFGMDSFKNTTSLASVTYHGPASYASLTAVGINTAALTIAPITTTNVVITAPVTSATPVSLLSSNGQFTSSIAWSGSPTTFAGATTYTATITLTPVNSYTLADVNANFFTINGSPATSGNLINTGVFTYRFPATVAIVPPVVYVAPAPVPYLKTLISPRIEMEPTQLLCWAGRYNFGYTLNGVIQGSSTSFFKPPYPYNFNLIINGVLQSLPPKANRQLVAVWDITSAPSGSVVSCSVTVKVNDLINTDKSTDNTTGLQGARTIQSQAIVLANNIYMVMNLVNSNVYIDALDKNRADWRASANSIPAAYHAELAHIKTLPPTKETRALATALRKNYMAALKKNSADYKASGPAALAAKNAANKAALDEMNTAITMANAAYGTFIESIGYGVLIP